MTDNVHVGLLYNILILRGNILAILQYLDIREHFSWILGRRVS